MTFLLCLFILAVTLNLHQLDKRIKEHQQELEQTREQLAEIQQRIEGLSKSEKAGLARIEAVQEQIAVGRRYIRQLDAQLSDRTDEIIEATRKVRETSAKIDARKKDLERRLIAIYKYGLLLPLQTVLSADNVTDISRRIFYLRWIARADKRVAEELAVLEQQLSEQRARLVAARSELEQLKAERVKEQQKLEKSRASESAMLEKVRTERKTKEQLGKELNKATAQLQDLIADLERRREEHIVSTATHYFEVNKGRLPWPVRGEILARFGSKVHPQYKTRTSNRGIDITTQPGTLVLAIAEGKVAYADHFMGYGKLVIVDHDAGFYTLYANLAQVTTIIGAEVISGSAVGKTKEHIHFEIRKQGKPVDPLDWLTP